MLKIRLSRKGKRGQPFFFIIVTNSKNPRDGKFIEKIGYFDPINKNNIFINIKKLLYWKEMGAQLTNVVNKLIKNYKI